MRKDKGKFGIDDIICSILLCGFLSFYIILYGFICYGIWRGDTLNDVVYSLIAAFIMLIVMAYREKRR